MAPPIGIAYVGCRRGGACSLFRIDCDGANAFQITSGEFQDWNPDWGAAGILFASNRGNSQGLWLVEANGSDLQQVTTADMAADIDPRWVDNTEAFVLEGRLTDIAAGDDDDDTDTDDDTDDDTDSDSESDNSG